ncbi:MAG: recombinase family protein [Myxococcales bacterium]|nr:MAG: recombinase family protein [Myxococcales bacterium]
MKATDKPIRCGIYGRVSTSGNGQDVGLQLEELRQVAEQRGWLVADTYIDEGISGSQESRPALDRMMADAQAGRLDVICVWKMDRLARSLQNLLQLLDEFTRLGIGFVSLRDPGINTTTPQGRLLTQLLGAFSEFEKALVIERTKAGLSRARAKGVALGRPRRDFDLRAVLAVMAQGHGLKATARILKIPRSTLRERLIEAGEWPRRSGSENPSDETA